jgi:hypothetical protein
MVGNWRDKYVIKANLAPRKSFCHCRKCQIESEFDIGLIWEQRGQRWFKIGSIEPVKRNVKAGK